MNARRLRHVVAATVLSGVATVSFLSPASAQDYPEPTSGPGNAPTSPPGNSGNTPASDRAEGVPFREDGDVRPGQRGHVSYGPGTVDPNGQVNGRFESTPVPLGFVRATSTGAFTFAFTVPKSAAPGQHHAIFASVKNGVPVELSVPINVVAAADANTGVLGALPRTGSDAVVPMISTGVALVLAGGGVVLVARRRRAEMDAAA